MNDISQNIKNRLSLRHPQAESLEILEKIADTIELSKSGDITAELAKVKALYPTCGDFERNFPSICFSIATGVGKTRLMGALIAYLYLAKKVRNFFVLAPNLTIYNKLITDFSETTHPKYVFKGIGEFVHNRPVVITGDNYQYFKDKGLFAGDEQITINVFNISKINSESRGGKAPKIKRLSEYLGDSYFNYLSELQDLVLLMDESHRYRAERGMEVLNELRPIIGLEMTATPQTESGGSGGAIKFKNVVYEYSLAKAIKDGFVKYPAVATRKDFDPKNYTPEDLDRIKIEDGVRIHEETKVALDIYARDTKTQVVKPFVLIVAKDTDHSKTILEMIKSKSFFDGYYADKVIEVHSNQRGEEKDENIAQLLTLEDPDNKTEIVIHVNMLKEGWDVTNLYTIVPLRTAASVTLREQTIGRGLRLPFGKRVGISKVDTLTIVAHDKFQEIVDEANKPDSIIRKENIITIDETELSKPKEVISSQTSLNSKYEARATAASSIADNSERTKEIEAIKAEKSILELFVNEAKSIKNIEELKSEDVKKTVLANVAREINEKTLFAEEIMEAVVKRYEELADEFIAAVIAIPQISIIQSGEAKSHFEIFDLDTKNLNLQPVSEEILTKRLTEDGHIEIYGGKVKNVVQRLENHIIAELMNYPEIDYDATAELLNKLASQAIEKFKTYLDEDKVQNVVLSQKRQIAEFIYTQMMEHFAVEEPEYLEPKVYPFRKIEEHNYVKYTSDKVFDFRETVEPTNSIPSKLFTGFKKACHQYYKFDSKTEKDFAIILEDDKTTVLKWLRPSRSQFNIWYNKNTQRYEPDFVVETDDAIFMVETKKQDDIKTEEVQAKKKAALEYCKYATDYNMQNSGKEWKYLLIPHNKVMGNASFDGLVREHLITQ